MTKLDNVLKIYNTCFLEKELSYFENLNIHSLYEYENKGYCILIDSIDIYEIFSIGVLKEQRNKGIATKLLKMLPRDRDIFLEVNEKNLSAINLYLKNGFKQIAVRKNYYGQDNALIMKKDKI